MGFRKKRIAVNVGEGYVPGLDAVFAGVVRAASELGWDVVGIRDGFHGLLFPDRYETEGLVPLSPAMAENPALFSPGILGTAHLLDPFRVRTVDGENAIVEKDLSDILFNRIESGGIDGVISVVGPNELGVAWKLARKGLPLVCVPKAVENDMAGTTLSFGFNSALAYVVDTLERARTAAETLGRIAVVEVLGTHAGWLALQSGIAVMAHGILIPELPYHIDSLIERLQKTSRGGSPVGLVVAAEGATPAAGEPELPDDPAHAVNRSGLVAENVALALQRRMDRETFPLVLGQLIRGGSPTAVDRQLGVGYGAASVRALKENRASVMTAFQPPDLTFVPLSDAVNRFRTVPLESEFIQVARSLGISLGD
jgi:ATP-dependent phosphofructokinase / diphosphate-dependent phosphofructokinase